MEVSMKAIGPEENNTGRVFSPQKTEKLSQACGQKAKESAQIE